MKTSITFLEQQNLANFLCFVHTEQRGSGWIVFKRPPDRISSNFDDIPEIEDAETDDEEFHSAETDDSIVTSSLGDDLAIPNDDASGTATENNLLSSADLSDGYKAITDPEESVSPCEPSLLSRDSQPIHSRYNIRGMTGRQRMVMSKMNQVSWILMTVARQMMKTTNQMTKQKVNP